MLKIKEKNSTHHLVSIAMATYNGEDFIREQLDSIYSQSYQNIEVIVCDDCSSDKTLMILDEYVQRYGLKLFKNESNLGYVKNFEKAISLCSGDYIALADQDDIWHENKIEKLLNKLSGNFLIHSDAYLISEDESIISDSHFEFSGKIKKPTALINLFSNGYVTGCTMLFQREMMNTILPFPSFVTEHDRWIAINGFLLNSIMFYDKPLIKYRQHNNNAIGATKNVLFKKSGRDKFLKTKKNEFELLNYFKEKNLLNNDSDIKYMNSIEVLNKKFSLRSFFDFCFVYYKSNKNKKNFHVIKYFIYCFYCYFRK